MLVLVTLAGAWVFYACLDFLRRNFQAAQVWCCVAQQSHHSASTVGVAWVVVGVLVHAGKFRTALCRGVVPGPVALVVVNEAFGCSQQVRQRHLTGVGRNSDLQRQRVEADIVFDALTAQHRIPRR
jgi:hypothetical protein